jgi:hypothetical protein
LKIGLASESLCEVIDTSSCIGKKKLGQCSKGHLEVMAYDFLVRSGAFCILLGLGSETGCGCVAAVGSRDIWSYAADAKYITCVFKYSLSLVKYKTLCFATTDVFPGVGRLKVDLAGKGWGRTS